MVYYSYRRWLVRRRPRCCRRRSGIRLLLALGLIRLGLLERGYPRGFLFLASLLQERSEGAAVLR